VTRFDPLIIAMPTKLICACQTRNSPQLVLEMSLLYAQAARNIGSKVVYSVFSIPLLLRNVSSYASKSRVQKWQVPPYFKKGSWTLPVIATSEPEVSVSLSSGSPRVPNEWRQNKELPKWKRDLYARREKFHGVQWNPNRKVSRTTMDDIRKLKSEHPHVTASDLGKAFGLSPEAVRRILKSRWDPTEGEQERIQDRWVRRGSRIRKILRERERSGDSTASTTGQINDIGNRLF
jgi:hypothetical protein